jgi:DNA replication protein DnaC
LKQSLTGKACRVVTSLAQTLRDITANITTLPDWMFHDPGCSLPMDLPGVRGAIREHMQQKHGDEPGFAMYQITPWCECEQVERRRIELLYLDANLPHSLRGQTPRLFQNFELIEGNQQAHMLAKRFVHELQPHVLVIGANPGRGKSHLAEAISREYLAAGNSVRYEVVPILLQSLRPSEYEEHGVRRDVIRERCHAATLLVLDDLGAEKPSQWTEQELFSLIDSRYASGKKLVVTTNWTGELFRSSEFYQRIGDRLLDRSDDGVAQVRINTEKSYREG